jgi:hypothetical protein
MSYEFIAPEVSSSNPGRGPNDTTNQLFTDASSNVPDMHHLQWSHYMSSVVTYFQQLINPISNQKV